MSRFIDELNQVVRAAPVPMGFSAGRSAVERKKMLLVASLAGDGVDIPAGHLSGADAGLLGINKLADGARALRQLGQLVPDLPWGGWLAGAVPGGLKPLLTAGADFVVFPASTPLSIIKDGAIGKILQVETSLGDGLLRAVGALPAEAVLMAGPGVGEALTWQYLMQVYRVAGLLPRPLLVPVPGDVNAAELGALGEAGVAGVVIGVAGQPEGRLMELKQTIAGLSFKRRWGREAALLPRLRPAGDTVADEGDEGDEDDEGE
ncbi:MAG: hypothetical protein V1780_00430 [Chloroflexota bacterium]